MSRSQSANWFTATLLAVALTIGCQSSVSRPSAWHVDALVAGSDLHGPNGITFGPDGQLYAGSVGSQSVYRIDPAAGDVTRLVGPPAGEADDVAFAPDGTLVWTALLGGEIRALRADGSVTAIATGMPLINPVDFTRDGRLFAAQIGIDRLHEFPLDEQLNANGEPRLVGAGLGNLNSFEIDADDRLFGPLFGLGQVAVIDIESGAVNPIASGFGEVVAVNLDAAGRVYAIEWSTGKLWRIDPEGENWRAPQLLATFVPPLDNLAVGTDGVVYVSRPAHSAIDRYDPATGTITSLVSGELAGPGGLAITQQAGEEALLVADRYGYRVVATSDGRVGATYDLTEFGFPGSSTAAAASSRYFALTEALTRPRVFMVDRKTGDKIVAWSGFEAPAGIVLDAQDNPLVADFSAGTLVALDRKDRKARTIIAQDLDGPVGIAFANPDEVYVTEALGGTVIRIRLTDGRRTTVDDELAQPEGIAVLADGRLAIVETGLRRVLIINPATGSRSVIAENLPVGNPGTGLAPVYLPSGIAQGANGDLFVSGDMNNSIVRLSER